MKNLTKSSLTLASLSVAALAAAPQQAQAFSISSGSILQLNGGTGSVTIGGSPSTFVDFDNGPGANLPFGSTSVTSGSTGSFAGLAGSVGQIADLSLAEITSGMKSNFIQLFNGTLPTADDVFFNLSSISGTTITPILGPLDIGSAAFSGSFVTAAGQYLGDGVATIQLLDGVLPGLGSPVTSSWSMTIVAGDSVAPTPTPTSVPTPALLPGLLGMGAAFARKRRAATEQSA